jgi:hypothetical protein
VARVELTGRLDAGEADRIEFVISREKLSIRNHELESQLEAVGDAKEAGERLERLIAEREAECARLEEEEEKIMTAIEGQPCRNMSFLPVPARIQDNGRQAAEQVLSSGRDLFARLTHSDAETPVETPAATPVVTPAKGTTRPRIPSL